jgi:hypothetical protein
MWSLTLAVSLLWLTPPFLLAPGWLFAVLLGTSIPVSVVAVRRRLLDAVLAKYRGALLGITWVLWTGMIILAFPVTPIIFIEVLVYGTLYLAGVGVLAVAAVRLPRYRAESAAAIVVVIVGAALLVAGFATIAQAGMTVRMRLVETRYQDDLSEISASTDPSSLELYPERLVDEGPPLRVAWIWWHGILDNVGGIVNDPSQSADQVRAVLTDDTGMLSSCIHLYADWYYCAFN